MSTIQQRRSTATNQSVVMDGDVRENNSNNPEESGKPGDDLLTSRWKDWMATPKALPPSYKLVSDRNYRKNSIWTLRFAILASAISTKMLAPNYAIMCSGDSDNPDAFPSTEPFGFNSATYFIP